MNHQWTIDSLKYYFSYNGDETLTIVFKKGKKMWKLQVPY